MWRGHLAGDHLIAVSHSLLCWSWFAGACHGENRPLRPLAQGPDGEGHWGCWWWMWWGWAESRQSSRAGVKISTLVLLVLIPVKTSPSARLQSTQQGANTWAGCCETAFTVYRISAPQTARNPIIYPLSRGSVHACEHSSSFNFPPFCSIVK